MNSTFTWPIVQEMPLPTVTVKT